MKRRVYFAAALILLSTGAWWAWERVRAPLETVARRPGRPFVRVAGAEQGEEDKLLQERAKFFDPTPLFIPTPQNYGYYLPDRLRKQPGRIFGDYPAKLHFEGASLPTFSPGAVMAPQGLGEILARANEVPFAGIGERSGEAAALSPRVAFMEIKSLKPGRFNRSVPLSDAKPPRLDFGPMEFLVSVGAAGLIGEPVIISGSGWPEVDVFFREFLVTTYGLGARLGPGRYRVLIGP